MSQHFDENWSERVDPGVVAVSEGLNDTGGGGRLAGVHVARALALVVHLDVLVEGGE